MSEESEVGLCARCRYGRAQPTARGARFWRCLRAEQDARFVRYPPLPVAQCPGFRSHDATAPEVPTNDSPRGEAG